MKIIYSCVVDQHIKFFRQGMLFVRSLRAVGVAPEDILVNLTPGASLYRPSFEGLGCTVRDTPYFADGKYCNKVAQLRNAPDDVDFVVCCDTDMVFMRNIAEDLEGKDGLVLGKVVDFDNPPVERFRAAEKLIGDLPAIPEIPADLNGKPTLACNFNGGLYILPGCHVRAFSAAWEEEALRLYNNPEVQEALGEFAWHIDQIAFCFTMNRLGLKYETLPISFNYPLHFNISDRRIRKPGDLRILHYHDAVDENGLPDTKKVQDGDISGAIRVAVEHLRIAIYLDRQKEHARSREGKRFTFVVGFHRSGTSLMASGCDALGYSTGSGELMAASFDNPKGYYESKRLVKINERVQKDLSSDWDDIFFSYGGRAQELAETYRLRIRDFLEREFLIEPHPNYILKDPRVMQTYGIWREGIQAMGLDKPEIVFIYRNPLECAESQRSRYQKGYVKDGVPFHYFGKDLRETLLLWYVYSVRFFLTLEGERLTVVRYGDLISKPEPTLRRVADWAGMEADDEGISEFATEFLETGLRHHAKTARDLQQATLEFPFIHKLFEQFEALADKKTIYPGDIRAIADTHREPFADLMRFDFLGRLFTVPKQRWIHERHMRAIGK